MKVRGAVLREMGLAAPYAESRPLAIEELELDAARARASCSCACGAAGLCHSDLSVIDGSRPRVMPMVLGHEAAGEVVETGPQTPGFAAGRPRGAGVRAELRRLRAVPVRAAPRCASRARRPTPPARCSSGERRWQRRALHHHLGVSAFADHIVVSAQLGGARSTRTLPFEIAALFGCAVLTGVGAALNSAQVTPTDSVAVFGLGGVGLAALLGAVVAGARTVVAVDVVPEKLELARELGATHAIQAGDDAVAAVREATGGGADKVIETVGNARVLAGAYAATQPRRHDGDGRPAAPRAGAADPGRRRSSPRSAR